MDIYYIGTASKALPEVDSRLHHFRYQKIDMIKSKLDTYKNIIDRRDSNKWSVFTNKTNPYRNLRYILKSRYNTEMCTNAWLKMYEIMNSFDIVCPRNNKFTSFHLCEAPGAFIASVNHYIKTRYDNVDFNWYGQSLIEKGKQFIGDDYGLLAKYPNRWLFGPSHNGDITDINNIIEYFRFFSQTEVDLVTADGGVDCSSDFNNQESLMATIIFAQILTALITLSSGKNFVIKMFTMFEPITISLMYLLYCVFGKVIVTKPITSKPCNSEVYVVCLNYNKPSQEYMQSLISTYSLYTSSETMTNPSIFPIHMIPAEFVNIIWQCQYFYSKRQAINIRYFIYKYDSFDLEKKNIDEIEKMNLELIQPNEKKEKHTNFIESNNIKRLKKHQRL